jgi:hypothetical protein
VNHSRSQQRTDQRVLVLTLNFLALKKTVFPPVKNTSLFSLQLFSADATIFSKKFEFIFAPENIKKRTSKVAHNQPQTFFSQYWPGCPNQPRIDFSYYKYVPRLICLIICVVNSLGSFFLAFLLAYSLINTILHSCIVAHIASEIAFLSEINDAIRFFETQKLCNNGVGHRVWIYIYLRVI